MIGLLLNKWVWIGLLALSTLAVGKLYLNARDSLAAAEASHAAELREATKEKLQAQQDYKDALEWAETQRQDAERANQAASRIADLADAERKKSKDLRKQLAERESIDADLSHCLDLELPDGVLPKANHNQERGEGISPSAIAATPPLPSP